MKKVLSTMLSVLVVLTFVFFAIASGTDAKTSSNGVDTTSEGKTSATAEIPVYKLNETVSIETSSGKYTVKVTGINETSKRNEFSDIQANRVILISYEYENVSYSDDLSVSDMNMKAYDKDNNLLETYPSTEEKYGSSVGTGRKSNGVVAYALNNENNYIEIDFYDNMFNSKADCRFALEW